MNPKVFIGSSVGNLNLAYAIQTNLEHAADVTVWAQGVFNLTSNALDDLISVLDESDFGIFVFSPQDIVEISNQQFLSVRDNVVFEFGLFIGRMGKERTFFVTPRNQQNFRLPTDLSGVTPATYDSNRMDNLQAALGPACFQMQRAIQNLGVRKNRLKQPDVDQHNKPTILCASSEQYGQFGFDEDVTIIQTAFPEQVSVEQDLSSDRLRDLLMEKNFDVVHVVAFVNNKTGDLVLSDIDVSTKELATDEPDTFPAEGFSRLIELSKTRLVVLATCDSLLLAAKLARVTNVIAATEDVEIRKIVAWERSFYKSLSKGHPLSNACEIANAATNAPMILLMKKDMAFTQ